MARFVGLDVSQKLTSICVVDETGRRVWRGQCASDPEQIARLISQHAGDAAGIGIETGPMTPWLVDCRAVQSVPPTAQLLVDAQDTSAMLPPPWSSRADPGSWIARPACGPAPCWTLACVLAIG